MSGSEGLTIAVRDSAAAGIVTLPGQLATDDRQQDEASHKQRAGVPARSPAALRYYDEDRDYQTGVQRASGARPAGRELMIDLPATLTAGGARQLANDSANRARWQHETVTWRIGELDPRIAPGSIVRLPDTPGHWLLRSWEWLDRGIALELERLAPAGGAARQSDPGESLSPTDLVIPPTQLAAFEVPPDASSNPANPLIFAAASGANSAWRGATLFAVQGTALVDLGTTGTQRAVMGTLGAPLEPSSGILFEPAATAVIDLVAGDLELADTDLGRELTAARVRLVSRHYDGPLLDVGIGAGQFVEARPNTCGFTPVPRACKEDAKPAWGRSSCAATSLPSGSRRRPCSWSYSTDDQQLHIDGAAGQGGPHPRVGHHECNALAAVARRTDRRSGGSALPRDGDLGGDRRSEGHASRDREEAKHDHQ